MREAKPFCADIFLCVIFDHSVMVKFVEAVSTQHTFAFFGLPFEDPANPGCEEGKNLYRGLRGGIQIPMLNYGSPFWLLVVKCFFGLGFQLLLF